MELTKHDKFLAFEEIQKIDTWLRDISSIGVMFYYGESPIQKDEILTNEQVYKPFLLQNTIMGLACLQHKGNMVLKLYESESLFTVGIIYILYSQFESILLNKPYTTSPLSSSQYLICKGLKNVQSAKEMVEKLREAYKLVKMNQGQKDILQIIDYMTIENEDALRQNITNSNLANNSVRTELMRIALANQDGEQDIDDQRAFQTKMEELKKWEVPILDQSAPQFVHQQQPLEYSAPLKSTVLKDMSAEQIAQQSNAAMGLLDDITGE